MLSEGISVLKYLLTFLLYGLYSTWGNVERPVSKVRVKSRRLIGVVR